MGNIGMISCSLFRESPDAIGLSRVGALNKRRLLRPFKPSWTRPRQRTRKRNEMRCRRVFTIGTATIRSASSVAPREWTADHSTNNKLWMSFLKVLPQWANETRTFEDDMASEI